MEGMDFHLRRLARLNEKVLRIQNFEKLYVNEAKVSILMEEVDESDVAGLKETIVAFKESVRITADEVGKLTSQISSNSSTAKAAAGVLKKYLESHSKALAELEKSAASVSFETGMGASLYAKNMTIPGLIAASTDAIGVLEAFLKGFEQYKTVVVGSLVPLAKSDDKSLSAQQSSAEKMPKMEKMVAKAVEVYENAKGSGIMAGAKSLLKALFSPIDTAKKAIQTSADEVKSVVAKFPKFDAKALGEATANLMLNVKVSALKGMKSKKAPSTKKLQEPAKAARSEAGGKGAEGDKGAEGGKDESPAGTTVEVDGKTYKKGKTVGWYDLAKKSNPGKSAQAVKGDAELLKKIIAAAAASKGAAGGTAGAEGSVDAGKIEKLKSEFKDVKPEDLAAALKKAGMIPEAKMLIGGLGFGVAKKSIVDDSEDQFHRWSKLAGIK